MTRAVLRASFSNGGTVVGLRRAWYFSAIGAQFGLCHRIGDLCAENDPVTFYNFSYLPRNGPGPSPKNERLDHDLSLRQRARSEVRH